MQAPRFAALAALLAAATPARATTVRPLGVTELTDRADLVLVGRVEAAEGRALGDGAIVTDVTIAVEARWKGEAPAAVRVVRLGGVVGKRGMRVVGEASFAPGERVVAFLRREGAHFRVVGMAQGKLAVVEAGGRRVVVGRSEGLDALGPGGRPVPLADPPVRPLDELERQVRARAGVRR